jgi:hypothetical protein
MGFNTTASWIGSMALGRGTLAKATYETAIGCFNTDYTAADNDGDRILVIGNEILDESTDVITSSDALIILKNGTITVPSFEIGEIRGNKALITKEYFDANNTAGSGGLESITENRNTGYRRADAANYGSAVDRAADLSVQENASTTKGATGLASFAVGANNTVSGAASNLMGIVIGASADISTATGSGTPASGDGSIATGIFTIANANGLTSRGNITAAKSVNETSMGAFNTDYTVAGNVTDRLFVIGNGSNGASLDALII